MFYAELSLNNAVYPLKYVIYLYHAKRKILTVGNLTSGFFIGEHYERRKNNLYAYWQIKSI